MLKVQLIVVQGKPEGKTIPLVGPVFRVGRGETCHLRPNSELVSREHTEITISGDAVTVRDLGSRNGTYINGKPIKAPHRLKNGELLQIGPLTFAVSIQGAASAAPASPSKATSLDDVSHEEIGSWLVADNASPTPDRPSGVYDGDTMTMQAFKAMPGAGKPAAAPAPPPAPAKPAAPAPTPAPAPVQAAAPAPAPAPAPPKPAPAKPIPAAPQATPPPPKAAPKPAVAIDDAPARPMFDDLEFEQLPEGEGDGEEVGAAIGGDEEGGEAAGGMPEEFIDESNPFYAARKAAGQPTAPKKEEYKDSSDAASDILRKMMDRRRPR
jgi:predicted component of type VI protein secretion system